METISPDEFLNRIRENPAWCADPGAPVAISGHVSVSGTDIEAVSSKIHFLGGRMQTEKVGYIAATFLHCKLLKKIEGSYDGQLFVNGCLRLETIQAEVTRGDSTGNALHLGEWREMPGLKTVSGTYAGALQISSSAVRELTNIRVTQPDNWGWAMGACDCPNLTRIQGTFNGFSEIRDCPELTDIRKMVMNREFLEHHAIGAGRHPMFTHLPKLTEFDPSILTDKDIILHEKTRVELRRILEKKERARKQLKQEDIQL